MEQKYLLKRIIALMSAVVLLVTFSSAICLAETFKNPADFGFDYGHRYGPECYDDSGKLVCQPHVRTDEYHQSISTENTAPETIETVEEMPELSGLPVEAAGSTEDISEQLEVPAEATVDEAAAEAAEPPMESVRFVSDTFSVYALVVTKKLETRYITAENETYKITVTYAENAAIPEGATLEVREIDGEEAQVYLDRAEGAVEDGQHIALARFFDIKIMDGGSEVQPSAAVTVTAELVNDEAIIPEAVPYAMHFADGDPDVVQASESEEAVSFRAESFSVWGVVYTVDFHWDVDGKAYDFSIPGGGFISLREMVKLLGIAEDDPETEQNELSAFVEDVSNVGFSNPDLVSVSRAEADTTVGAIRERLTLECEYSDMLTEADIEEIDATAVAAGDWALISLKAFETEETLTVSMTDGEVFEICVSDAQLKKTVITGSGEAYDVTVSYGQETGIPEGAALEVEELLSGAEGYGEYVAKTEDTLGLEAGSAGYIRLFDIKIVDEKDHSHQYQPAEGTVVDVRIELADSSSDHLNVVHFSDGSEEGEALQSSTENGEHGSVVSFQANSFSVYSVVDAPEPVPVYQSVNTLDDIEANQAYYLSIARSGTNYMTGETVLNSGTCELTGVTDRGAGEKWFFEFPEEGKVNIYCLDSEGAKKYLNVDASRNISFSETPQPLSIEETTNAAGTFYIYTVIDNKNWALSVRRNRNFFFEKRNNGADANERVVLTRYMNDPYELDHKTFGIAYGDESVTAAALMAEVSTANRLKGTDMLIRPDVLNNSGNLLVAENSDIQEWTFISAGEDKYYIRTTVNGAEKYLRINNANVTLVDDQASASAIQAMPGTDANSGRWHFTVGSYSLNYTDKNDFNAASNSNATTWLNLVEKSVLSDDDFVEYSARKISASDDILSATEKDENGQIIHDGDGNVVYRPEKTRVIIYTRVWNDTTRKYEFYAVDHDGSLIRVYESGDQINWVGNQVNSALWEFTEYTNDDGTPNYFYELENTAYAGTYLAPQSDSIISRQAVGVNLNGRRDGFDYSSIVAWDDPSYAYSGLKTERDENGSLRVVACPLDEAADFHFAVITPPVEEADPVTTVKTVDNDLFGINIRMTDFNNTIAGGRDSVQTAYLGNRAWDPNKAYQAQEGLVSTNLTDGYPTITADTDNNGSSLSELFNNMKPANHLFIQSVYNESGYFEYDSTQNFAHLNSNGDFTVYDQLGAIGNNTGPTRVHGQFMPYNDISAETGYAHDAQGNIIRNTRDIRGQELPDTDPRKGEPLYLIPQNKADYYFGMELSAIFTQTPDGVDNWGHDIIFEFTGDDDFWFYVDGELVLDLGGVHSAIGGSVNFRTGEVNCNGTITSLYEVFKSNYRARGLDEAEVDELFVSKTVNGETVHVFRDYTSHEMKMFYMERGAGASNLKMRFNLASVKPGTVELSKKLKGIDNASNKLIQYPYQIWYQTAEYEQNEDGYVLDGDGNRIITHYNPPVLLSQPPTNTNLTGQVYAVYKGTKKLIPYKESMTIGGITYNNIFLLKAGETAVINFPENTYRYKLVECGVDTSVYEHVYVNGGQSGNEVFGKPYNNTDGWDPADGEEMLPNSTSTYEGTTRSDFGITYYTTEGRPSVEYTNEVPPEVMRTVSLKKVLYDSEGHCLTDEQAAQVTSDFTFRLYLGNEFAERENLLPADMYTYYIKGQDNNYCKWDKAGRKFVSLGVDTFDGFKTLSEADRRAGTFTTSLYGSISKIPAGYTVEVRDLIVGTKYLIEEPDREIPRGYTRRSSDGYVRTDLGEEGDEYVYYTEGGVYGRHELTQDSTTVAEAISDTIASKTDSPMIEIRNQEGWGLTAKKVWTDRDFVTHDPIYLAVYLRTGSEPNYTYRLLPDAVRQLTNKDTDVYFFFRDLKVGEEPYSFDQFVVREVKLTPSEGHTIEVDSDGKVTVDENVSVTPIDDGGSIEVGGIPAGGAHQEETYDVSYITGSFTGRNNNIRVDTVTNSRPGLQIFKTDWSGENYLAGASFTLKDAEGNNVAAASYTSDSSGLVTTAYLSPGVYKLAEIKTPAGYVAMEGEITITVSKNENDEDVFVVTGDETTYYHFSNATETAMARITVKNRTVRELKVVKVDGDKKTPIEGVHFALYDQVKNKEGNPRPAYSPKKGFEDLVTKADGVIQEINMSLGVGTYYLREKDAPEGYMGLEHDLCFTIGENGTVTIQNEDYADWLTVDTSDPGFVVYRISVENTSPGLKIRKTDENGNPLTGAQFVLSRKNDSEIFETVSGYGLGENGLIDMTDISEKTFGGMSGGIYKLTETHAPEGYVITTGDMYFRISDGTVTLTDKDGNETAYSSVLLEDQNKIIVVKNSAGAKLPDTGGPGTTLIYCFGGMLVLLAGAGFIQANRKKRYNTTDFTH